MQQHCAKWMPRSIVKISLGELHLLSLRIKLTYHIRFKHLIGSFCASLTRTSMVVVSLVSHLRAVCECFSPASRSPSPCHLLCVIYRQLEVCGTLLGSFFSTCLSPLWSLLFLSNTVFALHVLTW